MHIIFGDIRTIQGTEGSSRSPFYANLREIFENLDDFSQLDMLVGFFYFSGFIMTHSSLRNLNIRVLIGLDTDFITNRLVVYMSPSNLSYSRQSRIQTILINEIKQAFEKDNRLDTKEAAKALELFIEKLKNGTLEIRKTHDPHHAKLYILTRKNSDHIRSNIVITGSSNFTYHGLGGQNEINVIGTEPYIYEQAKQYFERLWEDAIPVLNQENISEVEPTLKRLLWPIAEYTPYELFLKVVYEYFKLSTDYSEVKFPHDISRQFKSFEYQKDAILEGLDKLDKFDGILLADVVGLGKSIIASTIAYNWVLRNPTTQVIIISPPGLIPQWERYKTQFRLPGSVFSSSSQGIKKAIEHYKNIDDPKLIIVDEAHQFRNDDTQSYQALQQLTLGNKVILLTATPYNNTPAEVLNIIKLFQISKYTTLPTEYASLQEELDQLQKDYQDARKSDAQQRDEIILEIRKKLLRIIAPVLIRRTREDLKRIKRYRQDLKRRGIEFPKIKGPIELTYHLSEKDLNKYYDTLSKLIGSSEDTPKSVTLSTMAAPYSMLTDKKYNGFKGARYRPLDYILTKAIKKYENEIKDFYNVKSVNQARASQRQLAFIIRNILVHRFESSMYAFYKTLKNQIKAYELTINFLNQKGYLPITEKGKIKVEDLEKILRDEDEDVTTLEQLTEEYQDQSSKAPIKIYKKDLKPKFLDDLLHDYKILKNIWETWFKEFALEDRHDEEVINKLTEHDPKLQDLKKVILLMLNKQSNKKIVIFTQYKDTADYMANFLSRNITEYKTLKFTGEHRQRTNKHILEVLKNFDASYPQQEDNYHILVATDVLSEGVNLHRAGRIINYDIPYNPSRVVQRVGRINRIDKKVFDTIEIYNYFPTSTGESITNIKAITTLKQSLATLLFGNDTAILTPKEKELIEKFYTERYINEKELDKKWQNLVKTYANKIKELLKDKTSWDTKYRAIYENLSEEEKKKLENMPLKLKIRRTIDKVENPAKKPYPQMVIFTRKGKIPVFYAISQTKNQGKGSDKKTHHLISPQDGFSYFEATSSEKGYKLSDQGWKNYTLLRGFIKAPKDVRKGSSQSIKNQLSPILELLYKKATYTDLLDYLKALDTAIYQWDIVPKYNLKELKRTLTEFIQKYKINPLITDQPLPQEAQKYLLKKLQTIVPSEYIDRIQAKINQLESIEEIILIAEEFSYEHPNEK